MPKRLPIPQEVIIRSGLSVYECRTIINIILNSRKARVRQAHIFDLRIPKLGRIKSHGNKTHKHKKRTKKYDRRRKKKEYQEMELQKEKLLW